MTWRAPRDQVHRHLRHYMNWLPVDLVDAMAPLTGFAGPEEALAETLRAFAAIGCRRGAPHPHVVRRAPRSPGGGRGRRRRSVRPALS